MSMSPVQKRKKAEALAESMHNLEHACVDKYKAKSYNSTPYMPPERMQTANNPEGYERGGYAI